MDVLTRGTRRQNRVSIPLWSLFGGVSIPGTVNGTFILSAFLLTQVGVLGLYAPLADETPRLAVTGGLLVGITGLTTAVTLAWMLSAGLLNQPTPPSSLLIGLILGILVALLLFGLASVDADAPSRTSGIFLLLLRPRGACGSSQAF